MIWDEKSKRNNIKFPDSGNLTGSAKSFGVSIISIVRLTEYGLISVNSSIFFFEYDFPSFWLFLFHLVFIVYFKQIKLKKSSSCCSLWFQKMSTE